MADTMKDLLKAVREHSGMDDDNLRDVANHGASGGFPGFMYYKDTMEFYDKNEDAIWELLEENADSLGEKNPLALIATFQGAKDVHDDASFKNLLAWFALEEAARYLEDNPSERQRSWTDITNAEQKKRVDDGDGWLLCDHCKAPATKHDSGFDEYVCDEHKQEESVE